jgi:hypothetical protein
MKQRYLSPAVHDPHIASCTKERRREIETMVRWQCISRRTGKVVVASEWIPDTPWSRDSLQRSIDMVNKERRDTDLEHIKKEKDAAAFIKQQTNLK